LPILLTAAIKLASIAAAASPTESTYEAKFYSILAATRPTELTSVTKLSPIAEAYF
jgi:hypothetical protein